MYLLLKFFQKKVQKSIDNIRPDIGVWGGLKGGAAPDDFALNFGDTLVIQYLRKMCKNSIDKIRPRYRGMGWFEKGRIDGKLAVFYNGKKGGKNVLII